MMIKLTAPNGYVYSNGETSGKIVYLGKNDSVENWELIAEAEDEEATQEDYLAALAELGVTDREEK